MLVHCFERPASTIEPLSLNTFTFRFHFPICITVRQLVLIFQPAADFPIGLVPGFEPLTNHAHIII